MNENMPNTGPVNPRYYKTRMAVIAVLCIVLGSLIWATLSETVLKLKNPTLSTKTNETTNYTGATQTPGESSQNPSAQPGQNNTDSSGTNGSGSTSQPQPPGSGTGTSNNPEGPVVATPDTDGPDHGNPPNPATSTSPNDPVTGDANPGTNPPPRPPSADTGASSTGGFGVSL